MTVKNKLIAMLMANGMFGNQARQVMEIAKPELVNLVEGYSITLDSPSEEYPQVVYNVLYLAIRPIALKWIDDNFPLAWYRPMFIDAPKL
jgi:hypothetical protein